MIVVLVGGCDKEKELQTEVQDCMRPFNKGLDPLTYSGRSEK
jgi:hypothetical protein